jgi:hypothetical protein
VLALAFGFRGDGAARQGDIVSNLTDAAWALSMLWMVVVGITVDKAKRLSGRLVLRRTAVPVVVADSDSRLGSLRRHSGVHHGLRLRRGSLDPAGLSRRAKQHCASAACFRVLAVPVGRYRSISWYRIKLRNYEGAQAASTSISTFHSSWTCRR